jgi:hypothetical protein
MPDGVWYQIRAIARPPRLRLWADAAPAHPAEQDVGQAPPALPLRQARAEPLLRRAHAEPLEPLAQLLAVAQLLAAAEQAECWATRLSPR